MDINESNKKINSSTLSFFLNIVKQNKIKFGVIALVLIIIAAVVGVAVYKNIFQRSQERDIALKRERIKILATEANLLIEKGEWNKAINKYEEAGKEDPNNPLLWGLELNNKIYMAKTEEDIKKIEELLNNKTAENSRAFLAKTLILSKISFQKGEFQQAINYLEEIRNFLEKSGFPALSGITKNYSISNILATESYYYLFLGDIKKAEDLIAESLTLAPKNSLAFYFKSLIILDKDFNNIAPALEEAKIAAKNLDEYFAITKNASNLLDKISIQARLFSLLGELYRRSGNLEQAEEYINKGMSLIDIKAFPSFRSYQVKLYLSKKDYEKAGDYLNKWEAEEQTKRPDYYFTKALFDIENKNFSEAEISLNKALYLLEKFGPPLMVATPNNKAALKKEINKLLAEVNKKKI